MHVSSPVSCWLFVLRASNASECDHTHPRACDSGILPPKPDAIGDKTGTQMTFFFFFNQLLRKRRGISFVSLSWQLLAAPHKNFMHKYSFIVSELLRFKIPSARIFCSVDREGSGRINLPALRCREFSFFFFKCPSPQPSHTTDA